MQTKPDYRQLQKLGNQLSELTRQYVEQSTVITDKITGFIEQAIESTQPPTPPIPVLPTPTPVAELAVLKKLPEQRGAVGYDFTYTIPKDTFQGEDSVDVSDLPSGLAYDKSKRTIFGKPTKPDTRQLIVTAASKDGKIVQTTLQFIITADGSGVLPKPDTNPDIKPDQSNGEKGELAASPTMSRFSDQPFGYNRLQFEHPAYEDGWVLKSSEIAMVNADGFPDETPELLTKHGHNGHEALWYYGSDVAAPWGLPKKTDQLFFEVTGACWEPYRTCWDVLTTDLVTIGRSLKRTLPAWNSVPENGLIDGVATVKECHFNLEYAWFQENGDGDRRNFWAGWSPDMRNRTFFNYASGRSETFQQVYDRGGIGAIDQALHQKWRNIIGLSILIINRTSKMRAYYGDHKGIAEQHHIVNFSRNYSITDLFSSDVNDGSRFGEANEFMNAGELEIDGDRYTVDGNLRALAGISHNYDYEWAVEMTFADYQQFMSQRGRGNIHEWHSKMKPDLWRPYNFALHAMLTDYVREKKGWDGYKVYWQTEPIYESRINVPDHPNGKDFWDGAWVGWTLDAKAPFRACKIPLHPEICNALVYNARMNLQGLFLWGGYRRQNMKTGWSENTHPELHQTGREGFQIALDTINQHRAFGRDTQQLLGNIRVWNEDGKNWVDGDPSRLALHNGRAGNGLPAKPLPLVTGVYRPSTGIELYQVYYPHNNRHDTTPVRFKSPVDGKELNAVATGWGPTLWVRKR